MSCCTFITEKLNNNYLFLLIYGILTLISSEYRKIFLTRINKGCDYAHNVEY